MKSVACVDAVIVGGGLVGRACAAALARDGASAILLNDERPGQSSSAAAGMLAPSIDRGRGAANDFAVAARDGYPAFIDWLERETAHRVPLNTRGILRVAASEAGARGLRRAMLRDDDPAAEWLEPAAVRALEPALDHALGAVFHPRDGAVDNVALMAALLAWCEASPAVEIVHASAIAIGHDGDDATVRASDGTLYRGRRVVMASGAWASSVVGLPRRVPVTPLRGQMLAYEGSLIDHVVFGPRGYVVPRPAPSLGTAHGDELLVGATSESVGFESGTTDAAAASLHVAGADILPSLRHRTPVRHWAGLRPVTPDLLPILGPDPDDPTVLYACGHSRNGILMAPLTGDCLSAIVQGRSAQHDITPFSIERFPRA